MTLRRAESSNYVSFSGGYDSDIDNEEDDVFEEEIDEVNFYVTNVPPKKINPNREFPMNPILVALGIFGIVQLGLILGGVGNRPLGITVLTVNCTTLIGCIIYKLYKKRINSQKMQQT